MPDHATPHRRWELPRWIARLRADLCGYFWAECPICGRMFGGFEHAIRAYADDDGNLLRAGEQSGTFHCVCRRHEFPERTPEEQLALIHKVLGELRR